MTRYDKLRCGANWVYQLARVLSRRFEPAPRPGNPKPGARARLEEVFAAHAQPAVYLHVGLREIQRKIGEDPYAILMETVRRSFPVIMVPGFTPSFRNSGVYHKVFSRPEYGTFAQRFHAEATSRTDDPIQSILVSGEFDFSDCDPHDSFGPKSCFAKLVQENVLFCNVGSRDFRLGPVHHVEWTMKAPYASRRHHHGVIYYDETRFRRIEQKSMVYVPWVLFNRGKVVRAMRRAGILAEHDIDGLKISFFQGRDFANLLEREIRRDPVFLMSP